MAEGQTFYDEGEVEEILRIAVHRSGGAGGMSRERLLATAEELGIDAASVEAAEQQVRQGREEAELRREYQAVLRRTAWSSVSSWLSGSVVLLGINLITSGFPFDYRNLWSVWPIGIWGLMLFGGMIRNALDQRVTGDDGFLRWRKKRERRAERRAARGLEHQVMSVVEDALDEALDDRVSTGDST